MCTSSCYTSNAFSKEFIMANLPRNPNSNSNRFSDRHPSDNQNRNPSERRNPNDFESRARGSDAPLEPTRFAPSPLSGQSSSPQQPRQANANNRSRDFDANSRPPITAPRRLNFDNNSAESARPRDDHRGPDRAYPSNTNAPDSGYASRDSNYPKRVYQDSAPHPTQARNYSARPASSAPYNERARPNAAGFAQPDQFSRPASSDGPIRLNKRMSELGLCSRREADDWIARGWVKVNGAVAVMGQTVVVSDHIQTHRGAQEAQQEKVTILIHKPISYVSGQAEDGYTPAAALINADSQWSEDLSPRRFSHHNLMGLAPAGRLDIDSTGLLVLTQDGRVARQIIGENSHIEKEYLVRVSIREVDGPYAGQLITENIQAQFPPHLLAKLRHGLSLDGQALRPAKVDWINPEQLKFVLTEGKKRQIRRMCELVGLHVVGLKRVRIGRVVLGHLPVGQWRYLSEQEVF
jgi:23S rRNA pseudouridine2604 synthase